MPSPTPSSSRAIIFICLISLSYPLLTLSLSLSTTTSPKTAQALVPDPSSSRHHFDLPQLSGDWSNAKQSLRNPKCCVVAVPGLERHLSTLQQYFCGEDSPSDLDLRMRVRCKNNNVEEVAYEDCTKVYNAVMGSPPVSAKDAIDFSDKNENSQYENNQSANNIGINHPCVLALEELARGVASLADGPLEGLCTDVHLRVVCASKYEAIDPMFHSDKCPLRGYATLTGPGTEYMDETCLPWEYAALRTFGVNGLGGAKIKSLKTANELEFIIMKGDHYDAPLPDGISSPSMTNAMLGNVWSRSSACVHRSPPGASSENSTGGKMGKRRVILSLDLADGMDDQEWYESSRKRGWRSGMTQRKSRLVS